MMTRLTLALPILVLAATSAAAQGLIIPDEPDVPPLALTAHHVKVSIDRQAAVTTVEQVFHNHTNRQLEAQYVFPIPRGAVMSRFTMLVNGKEQAGDLVEKEKARQIYTSIVNRARDPGLLECIGSQIFRARIFPIPANGKQRITVRFQQVLEAQESLVGYTYPVRSGGRKGPRVLGEFSIEVGIASHAAIRNIYSPSHRVNVTRADDHAARVTYEQKNARIEKDFRLFYTYSDREVGLNLATYRPDPSKPGWFMMLMSPRRDLREQEVVERDIVFVVDTSGSMSGKKIEQARGALKHCITSLNDGDRFNIVRFSSFVEPWKKTLVGAKEHRAEGLAYADTLLAQGGTDIAGALDAALSWERKADRPYFVIFLTDGKPTVGKTTDPKEILAALRSARGAEGGESMRVFTWGVGYDVNTHLLDGMALHAGGVSEYVRPEESIEEKVSAFYNKASRPVLTHLDLSVVGEKVKLVNVYPRRLPDLYAGGQLIVFGRYTGSGDIAMTLKGRVNKKVEAYTYEGAFAEKAAKHDFIEPLWAQRRIADLLDQIRLNGEQKELVDDVIRLSKEYGIQTPYTSYLVLEGRDRLSMMRQNAPRGGAAQFGARTARPATAPAAPELEAKLKDVYRKSGEEKKEADDRGVNGAGSDSVATKADDKRRELGESLSKGFHQQGGKAAVETAKYLRRLRESNRNEEAAGVRRADNHRFFAYRGMWVDERFTEKHAVTIVKFGSEAYFRILERHAKVLEPFQLGEAVILVTAEGKALVIGDAGEEKLEDGAIDALFQAASK